MPRGHIQGMLFWVLSPTSSTLEEVEMLASVVAWGVAEEPVSASELSLGAGVGPLCHMGIVHVPVSVR